MRAKSKKLEPLGGMLAEVLDKLGLSGQLVEYQAVMAWSKVVGANVGQHARAEWIEKGELIVRVDSHVWIQELTFLKPEIIQKLNSALGAETVKDIRFVIVGKPRED
jgi:predicted nucleic acid-binding Zn ribbon protein